MAYCYIIIELNKMNIDEYLYEQKLTKRVLLLSINRAIFHWPIFGVLGFSNSKLVLLFVVQ